ncbi:MULTISPECIES: nascent polypeptide-associated complex protein [Acidianus]|uniref:Nascent polypeptide-associated complex protein n=1 Tax=Candidatus Acidianus copahuensis TaxID=1160895 RepID=A0A031LQR1_9CREN|nr:MULTISPECIES: nascent polypeptide-associated complex protein [Acidianus]EZQ06759.1 NagC family transcriptional regulator [Candidatus Acidianus copahuensis]NON61261.1 NagC family transcriptional regulator [Acidianus sp. RZ1]
MKKISQKDLKNLQRMGIKAENIDAIRVIIETKDENIIIDSPTVIRTSAMGQDAIMVSGGQERVEKKVVQSNVEIKDEDIKFVAQQTGKTEVEAKDALIKAKGDIAQAILILSEQQGP